MLLTRFEPHDVAGPNVLDGLAFALHPAEARRDDERLSERMRVPGGPCAGLKGDDRAANARRRASLKRGIDSHRAGKPVAGTFGRWL